MEAIPMGEDYCPQCNKLIDTCTGVNHNDKPNPGDISICIGCGGINRYGSDMALEIFPNILLDNLDPEERVMIIDAQLMIRQLIKEKKG